MSERGAMTENPLRAGYWFGKVDPRPLAVFRILFGLGLLHDLVNYTRDLRAFLADDGMLPRGVQGAARVWSVFELTGNLGAIAVIYAVGFACVTAFTLGYRAQLTALLSWAFVTSVHTRNLYVIDGGDDLARYLLFLSIFADTGACWSVSAWLAKRKSTGVPAYGLRFLQLHLALLYFVAARLKFRSGWLAHNVIYQCLQLSGFVRPLGRVLLQYPGACRASTVLTLVLEFAFAFLAFSPWKVGSCRALAIFCGVAVQAGILLTMRVGVFTESMLAAMALFLQPAWLDYVERRIAAWRARPWSSPQVIDDPNLSWPDALRQRGHVLAVLFLGINFITLAWGPFAGRRFPLPEAAYADRRWLWLDQPFGLFDVIYPIPRWHGDGVTERGTQVDALGVAIPDLVPTVRWRFSRWYKFTFKGRERPIHFPELAAYICRAYQEKTGEPLRELTLAETLTPPALPGQPQGAPTTTPRWHQVCLH